MKKVQLPNPQILSNVLEELSELGLGYDRTTSLSMYFKVDDGVNPDELGHRGELIREQIKKIAHCWTWDAPTRRLIIDLRKYF